MNCLIVILIQKGLATNTFMNVFAIFGGFLGVFMLCGLYKFSKLLSSGRRIYTLLFCLILFLMLVMNQCLTFHFYIFFSIMDLIGKVFYLLKACSQYE